MAAAKNTRRFYQNNHVCTELDGSVTRSIFRHQGSPLALCTSGAEESRSIMAVDNSNTVMSELRDSGKAQFAYTPYGHRTVQGESNNPLAFNGEILDTPTDCYLLGSYRLASPRSYRFYSHDDQSPFGKGGLNSKAYCAGDPVNNVDPTGHFPLANFLNIAMGITGAATVGTAIAGALVKNPKSQNILNITATVLAFATTALMAGAYVNYRSKSFQLKKSNQRQQVNINDLKIDNQSQKTTNQILEYRISSLKQVITNRDRSIARQQLLIDRQQSKIDRQQSSITRQQHLIDSQQRIINNQQRTINNQQRSINSQLPATNIAQGRSSSAPNLNFSSTSQIRQR